MLDLVDLGLAVFWLGIAIVLFEMARASQKIRSQLSITFRKASGTSSVNGASDVSHLEPVIKHMLSVDVNGFRISAAAAIVEFVLVIYHLLF